MSRIGASQAGSQIVQSILGKVSYHAVYDDSIMDALQFARANGFAGVQVAVELPHLSFENTDRAARAGIAAFCAENGLSVSLHAPDDSTSLFVAARSLVAGTFEYFRGMFEFADQIGSRLITFHAGAMPSFSTAPRPGRALPDADEAAFRVALEENLRRLIDLAHGQLVLCVENVGLTSMVREVLRPHLEASELALCWDLAKSHDDQELQEWLWLNVQHVRQVHLHDVCPGYSHQVIGMGTLDFMRYLPRLAGADVLDFCIEVRPQEEAVESLANLKRLARGGRGAAS